MVQVDARMLVGVHRLAGREISVRPVLNVAQEGTVAPAIVPFGHDHILAYLPAFG